MGLRSAKDDKSAGVYDGAKTITECVCKQNVVSNERAGRRPVPHGTIPARPLVPLSEAAYALGFCHTSAGSWMAATAPVVEATAKAKAKAKKPPLIDAVLVPPSAFITSQST